MDASILSISALPQIQWGAAVGASLVAARWDLRVRRIPNWLTGPLLVGGFIHAGAVAGMAGLGDAASGCMLLGFPYLVLFIFAGGGAGDAKLMGAVGAWLGLSNSIVVLPAVAIAGGVLGVAYAIKRGRVRQLLINMGGMFWATDLWLIHRASAEQARDVLPAEEKMLAMPYALAIMAGVSVAGVLVLSGTRMF